MQMKFEITIAQTKVLVVTAEGKNADTAIEAAKKAVDSKDFDSRIGARVVANVRELKDVDV